MMTIFTTMLEMSIKAGVVIVVVMLARVILAKAPKKYSYFLWSVVAFRLCVPISFQSIFSIFGIGKTSSETASSVTGSYADTGTIFSPEMLSDPPVQSYVPNEGSLSLDIVPNDVPALAINWEQVLEIAIISIWLIGVAAMILYGIVSYIKIHRKMQDAILMEKNIYYSDKIVSPFTLGIIRPKIYLPFGLSNSEQMCIIEHERCHIRRHDHIIKIFAYIPLAIHWFNPLCWLAFNRMTLDMEMSCDEKVLTKHDDTHVKQQYTNVLLSFASGNRFPTPNPIAFSDTGSTKARIKHTLYWKKSKVWDNMVACLVCLTTLITCSADATADTKENGVVVDTKENSAVVDTDDAATENVPIETEPKNLLDILHNKQTFIAEDGTETLLRNYRIPGRPDNRTIHAQAYTFVDFNLDGTHELVVQCTEEADIYMIIRLYKGNAYGYSIGTRSFMDLKTDGTVIISSSDGAGIQYINKITFNQTTLKTQTVAMWNDYESIYQIDGKNVSKQEADNYFEKWDNKESASFLKSFEITVDYADDELINDQDGIIYFLDKNERNSNWNLVIQTDRTITDFKFLAIDESESIRIDEILYAAREITPEKPFVVSTYINDATTNRGISFVDPNGVRRYYYISQSCKDGSLSLNEFSPINKSVRLPYPKD